jgi:mono/diheme cytochrome c family protein
VRACWLYAAAAGAVVIAGCGESPSARFVLSERTKKLVRPAQSAVEDQVAASFGDPNHLVVWQKLPVDFGDFEGALEQPAGKVTDVLQVHLDRKAGSAVPYTIDNLKGAAVTWTSGSNVGASVKSGNKTVPVEFQVAAFDPASSELSLRVIPAGAVGALDAPKKGDKLAVHGAVLQRGHRLYMTHCEHCHGVSGDGDGPTAKYFDIKPRDYRMGIFKFTSTRNVDKARRDDLIRTVRQGIPGTYMPSFMPFTDEEVGAIVEYVRWLAMRGEFEQKLDVEFEAEQYSAEAVRQRIHDGEKEDKINDALAKFVAEELPQRVSQSGSDLQTSWTTAEKADSLVVPKQHRTADGAESRERGHKLFLSDVAKCAQCHGPAGRGNGPQTEDYQTIVGSTKKYPKPGLFDVWDHPIKPRDLTSGIYRGGRRPVDIYRRVYSGIKGTPMPPFGSALNDQQIWDLVNYVMSIPYQKGTRNPEQPEQSKIAAAVSENPLGKMRGN